ncbi:MAG: CNP1-like family protein [Betaproteobacteria bacterium]
MKLLLSFVLAFFTVTVAAQPVRDEKTDWEKEQDLRNWKEVELKLPAYPGDKGLIELQVQGTNRFRFFVDPESVAVGPDGVVRYTFVARSPSGYTNVSFEGIRCATAEYKTFAFGNEGKWSARDSEWRRIESKSTNSWHYELRVNYFCPDRRGIQTAAEGVNALRKGGHPDVSITRFR